ncbi:MAG: hypothetical protein SVP52_09270 [Chloroflexota bacterium]|nr:hypothetical protein [Chloroflexota bacterium]
MMYKKFKKNVMQWSIGLMATLLIVMTPLIFINPVIAKGQETCPKTGTWVKKDGLSGTHYTYTAPEGKLIAETCYKAATYVIYNLITPPKKSVTVTSTVGHDLSHASFRLVNKPNPSPIPTKTFTPTPTFTQTPTDDPTPSPTPTETFTSTPTFTQTPTDDPTPSPTPTETFTSTPTFTQTPTDKPTLSPTPTEELEFISLSLSGICSDSVTSIGVLQLSENTITWSVNNENNQPISFNWSANNGQSGSATAPANGGTSFITDIDGYAVLLEYSVNNEVVQEQASIEPCEPQQETEEPTPAPSSTPTEAPTEETTEEPTTHPTDSQPDQPAGGSGPSLVTTIIPFMIGIFGFAAVSTIALKNKKEKIS